MHEWMVYVSGLCSSLAVSLLLLLASSSSAVDQALVSQGLLLITCSFSFAAQVSRKVGLFTLDLDAVGRGELWRLLTHQLVWGSTSEFVLGTMLLYTLRMFERQFGARKFAACALFLHVVSTIVQSFVLLFSRGVVHASAWSFASGPYALLFGLMVMFFADIPQSTPFKLFGLPLSDKLFVHLLAAQLAFANWPGPAYTALIGLVLGALYRIECLPFHRLRIPVSVSSACGSVFRPLLSGNWLRSFLGIGGGPAAGAGHRFGGGGQALGRAPAAEMVGQGEGAGYAPVGLDDMGGRAGNDSPRGEILAEGFPPQFAVQANPAAVQQLMGMGFSEERARAALMASGNNVGAATNMLLGSS